MSSICLNMIVKDERQVIQRCLESVAPLIDSWVISDTGSGDGTQELIQQFFAKQGIPGLLIEHEWQDFAHNRNLVLKAAQEYGKADYLLFMDADDYLQAAEGFEFDELRDDAYMLNVERGGVRFTFPKLLKASRPWEWKGVVHEIIEPSSADAALVYSDYPGEYCIYSTTEGARGTDPDKYKRDIELLVEGLRQEPGNARYQFYLAQSYRDDGNFQLALEHYQQRAVMSGWDEEVYYSKLEVARCQQKLDYPIADVLDSFLGAHHFRPSRLEALCEAINLCRVRELYETGYQLGLAVKTTPMPKDSLFVEPSVYRWRLLDEISVCAIYAGDTTLAKRLITGLLRSKDLPDSQRQRLESNLTYT